MSDSELLVFIAWGGGSVVFWSFVFARSVHEFNVRRDDRSRREMLQNLPLVLCAWAAAVSLGAVLLRDLFLVPPAARAVLSGLAWGAFAAAGLIRALDERR